MITEIDNRHCHSPVLNPDNEEIQTPGYRAAYPFKENAISEAPYKSRPEQPPGNSFAPELAAPQPRSSDELVSLLLLVKTRSSNEQIKASQDDVQVNKVKQQQKHDEILEQIEKSIEAGDKAKKGGVFGKIFGWIAGIATAIAGAALVATGVGAVAGAAMLALAVDGMVGMATGHSLMGELTKGVAKGLEAMGMSETAANIVASVTVAVATIAVTAGAGMASAARAGGGLITKIASSTQQAQKFQTVGNQVKNVSLVTSSTAEVGSGAASVTTGVYNKQSMDARANQMDMKKELAKLQALMEAEQGRLKDIVEKLNESVTRILQMMGNDHNTRLSICRNMV